MSIPVDHHYLPQFFQTPWADENGRVVVYRRPWKELVEKRLSPKATGYQENLYANENKTDPAEKQALESGFMSWIDNKASNAHQHLLINSRDNMATDLIIDWTRFLMSLLHRSPDRIEYLNAKIATYSREDQESFTEDVYNQHREPSDPATFDEWLNLRGDLKPDIRIMLLKSLIDSPRIGAVLANMKWAILRFSTVRFDFLTGDLPLITSDGLGHHKSYVLLAISPTDLFIAAARNETIDAFRSQPQKLLETACNDAVARQSRHVIIAANSLQYDFISKRFLKVGLQTGTNGLATWNSPVVGW